MAPQDDSRTWWNGSGPAVRARRTGSGGPANLLGGGVGSFERRRVRPSSPPPGIGADKSDRDEGVLNGHARSQDRAPYFLVDGSDTPSTRSTGGSDSPPAARASSPPRGATTNGLPKPKRYDSGSLPSYGSGGGRGVRARARSPAEDGAGEGRGRNPPGLRTAGRGGSFGPRRTDSGGSGSPQSRLPGTPDGSPPGFAPLFRLIPSKPSRGRFDGPEQEGGYGGAPGYGRGGPGGRFSGGRGRGRGRGRMDMGGRGPRRYEASRQRDDGEEEVEGQEEGMEGQGSASMPSVHSGEVAEEARAAEETVAVDGLGAEAGSEGSAEEGQEMLPPRSPDPRRQQRRSRSAVRGAEVPPAQELVERRRSASLPRLVLVGAAAGEQGEGQGEAQEGVPEAEAEAALEAVAPVEQHESAAAAAGAAGQADGFADEAEAGTGEEDQSDFKSCADLTMAGSPSMSSMDHSEHSAGMEVSAGDRSDSLDSGAAEEAPVPRSSSRGPGASPHPHGSAASSRSVSPDGRPRSLSPSRVPRAGQKVEWGASPSGSDSE